MINTIHSQRFSSPIQKNPIAANDDPVRDRGMTSSRKKIESISSQLLSAQSISHAPAATSGIKSNQAIVLDFFCELPVFKENAELRSLLKSQLHLSKEIVVTPLDNNTIQIDCMKNRAAIDATLTVTKKECKYLDPQNPLLTTDQPITIDHLQRFGSIDPVWWNWFKTQGKKSRTFGPRLILRRTSNTIQLLQGVFPLNSIEFKKDSIVFRALWLSKSCNWTVKDFLLFLTKLKVM